MHESEGLDCKMCYDETYKYFEIFLVWNRISLDLNYSRLAGTSLTVINEIFQL